MEAGPLVQNIKQVGVIVTVLKITNMKSFNQPIYVEIRTDDQRGDRVTYDSNPGRKTRLVNRQVGQWNQSFFYNTLQLVDDNLTFILKLKDGTELARNTQRNVKFWQGQKKHERNLEMRYQRSELVGYLQVRVQFKYDEQVLGGIYIPDLSLAPKYPYNPKYNAVDGYNPNAKTSKANCFSFYDGDQIPGFDYIDIFPAKFTKPKDLAG